MSSMKKKIAETELEVCRGDIARQEDLEAVVNAANAELMPGGGVAGAIHRAAGPQLAQECRPRAPIRPGQAVITSAQQMPNSYIIHCLGPVYGHDEPSDELLAQCYQNALALSEENKISSIGFPLISAGAFGYPMKEAASIALQAIEQEAEKLQHLRLIRFVLFGEDAFAVFEELLSQR